MRHVFSRQKTLKRVALLGLLFASPLLVAAAPPTVSITNTGYATTTPTVIGFTVDDLSASITCGIDGGAQSVCTGTSTHTLNSLSEGSHTLRIEATNTGNEAGVSEATFIKDTIAPYISVFSYSTTSPTQGNVRVIIGSYSEQPGTLLNFSSDTRVFTENGSFTYYFTDLAGNAGSSTVTVSNIDRVAPLITIQSYSTTSTNMNMVVTAGATDAHAFSMNTVSHIFTENGSFDFVATDEVGNVSTSTVTIININRIAPALSLLGNSQITLRVGDEFTDPGALFSDDIDSSRNVKTTDTLDATVLGFHTLTYSATDTAGNVATTSRVVEIIRRASSGGGGGGVSFLPAVQSVASVGKVLGASVYNFTRDLSLKTKGEDVTALQELLFSQGYLKEKPTGYFGVKTQAAVKAYQKTHTIKQTGTLGPLTRASLGSEILQVGTSSGTVTIEALKAQLVVLQSLLLKLQGNV